MKKFVITIACLVLLYIGVDYLYFHSGLYIDLNPGGEVTTVTRVRDGQIQIDRGNGFEDFEIRGVDMGSGMPGKWATDFAVDKETYIRWFGYIKELGANTIRVYTVQRDVFYNALYEYNKGNPDPLYLIQGVWVNDYVQNSHMDAFDDKFSGDFMKNCRTMLDAIHGKKKLYTNEASSASSGDGTYSKDVSPWVIGYILGVEWEDVTVAYTDELHKDDPDYLSYQGKYMYTSDEASPFEVMLAMVGDSAISYESRRYKEQRVVAFSNWPTVDPFDYPEDVSRFFLKCAKVDVEHILSTDEFTSGQFISYHVYPYYPDYLAYIDDWSEYGLNRADYIDENGRLNTYAAYLKMLADYHTMPVVISEFGVSTGRGMAQKDMNTARNQGHMSEKDQGQALIDCYNDIMGSGCVGCCVFSWQDEWFKRTWNTMYAINLERTSYWSDYQTNEQYFGLMSFDPGNDKSVCYVDGDVSEWTEADIVSKSNDMSLSMKYDEKFVYFMIHKQNLDFENDTIYIPIDLTPKSGTNYASGPALKFDRDVDFLITINGKDDSRIQVQEYYEALRANYSENAYGYNTYFEETMPVKDAPNFVNIDMILQTATILIQKDPEALAEVYETGQLTYGNANPDSPDFNSLADFICRGDYIELKLPWQILNFSDPSRMTIHDDYYSGNYGVENIKANEMYVGITDTAFEEERMTLDPFPLKGWGNKVTYHERLKSSYYILKKYWTGKD